MKKVLIAIMILTAIMAVGCSQQEAVQPEAPAQPEATPQPAEAPVQETGPVATLPQNDMGLIDVTIPDLKELVSGGGSFYLYIAGSDLVPYDVDALKEGVATLLKDYHFPSDFYYVDESILTEEEYAMLQETIGQSEVAAIAPDGQGVATYAGLYAFENGALKNRRYDFVKSEENTGVASNVINFIFESDLFQNDHGWDMISYDQLKEKIASGEKFMVYIGRDTCPYCMPFALCMDSALTESPINLPLCYFYTQSYKTAINNKEDGAQEAWDSVKADIGFQFTPSLLVFEGGEQKLAYDGGVGSEYFEMTDEEKQANRQEVAADLVKWFGENGLSD